MRPLSRNLCCALTVAASAAAAAAPPTPSPDAVRFDCTGVEFVFAEVCTGRPVGVIGLALFDHRGADWAHEDDALLERLGIRNVTDRRANYAVRADWRGFACQSVSANLLELKGVVAEFLYSIPMNKCQGQTFANGNFAVR